jgi:glycyl-tRNA synthetase beta chain
MIRHDDFLVEVHTEELPPKAILKLAEAFRDQMASRLQKASLSYDDIQFFAAPRRLAVFAKALVSAQPDQLIERRGPAKSAAFDAQGQPTPACMGFARSCGVTPDALVTLKTEQGEWMGYIKQEPGKSALQLLPAMVEESLLALPIPKRMRWGDGAVQFTRPIHSILMLYGADIVPGQVLGFDLGRMTRGHRFHSPAWLAVSHASVYESLLAEHHVIADFERRRSDIVRLTQECVAAAFGDQAKPVIESALLDEVTGLVEYPVALFGKFDEAYLHLPKEVLISAMQDHQRYFPVIGDDGRLRPCFVTISNIISMDAQRVVHGNERVLRARLSDAAFFFATDQKTPLADRLERLKQIVFQAKLGTLFDKSQRLSELSSIIAEALQANPELARQAGWLAKADLTTDMVGEFPELQGVMGYYYGHHEHLPEGVSVALRDYYLPRFAGDELPRDVTSQALALADRMDTLIGTFGINQIPTGDKDPFGLRRAALGVVRIIIENQLHLDLAALLNTAHRQYAITLGNQEAVQQVFAFILDRLRGYYLDQGISPDVFAAVAALELTDLFNFHKRIHAVQIFKTRQEAEALSAANKRVCNILAKFTGSLDHDVVDPGYFEHTVEEILAKQLEAKSEIISKLAHDGKYDEVLLQLADLRQPVDDFFDQVMVMTDDKARRDNRLLMLTKLRALFLQVADIALLQ